MLSPPPTALQRPPISANLRVTKIGGTRRGRVRDRCYLVTLLRPLGPRVIAGPAALMLVVSLLPAVTAGAIGRLVARATVGGVEDSGTHDELVGRDGSYALMFRQQAAAFA